MDPQLLINFIDNLKKYGIEHVLGRYYGFYRGVVVSNTDEDGRGRIEVKIPFITGDEPLASKAYPKDFRIAGKDSGEFYPPDVGDTVYVEFENGDLRFPVYCGGYHGDDETPEDFIHEADEPKIRGFKTKYGHKILYDERGDKQKISISTPNHSVVLDDTASKEAIYVLHKSGSQVNLDKNGSINLLAKNGTFVALNAKDGELTLVNATGALVTIKDGITISESGGKTLVVINKDGIQLTSDKKLVAQSSSTTISSGAITLDATPSKIEIGNGKMKLQGLPGTELVDSMIKVIDAFLNAPVVTSTGVGPSGPFMPDIILALTTVKTLLTAIKS